MFEGQRLRDHAATGLAGFVDQVIGIGDADGAPDCPHPGLGPLGGIAGALDHAARHGFDSVLTTGCDMPRLSAELIAALVRRAPAWCVDAPVLGHWPVSLASGLVERLRSGGDRSVRRWAREIGALPVASRAPLANVNTPADLAAL